MPYINLTLSTVLPAHNYIRDNLTYPDPDEKNCIKEQVLARGGNLLLIPASVMTGAFDSLIGLGAAVGTILTLGKLKVLWDASYTHLDSLSKLIAEVYFRLIKFINPKARFSVSDESLTSEERYMRKYVDKYELPLIGSDGNGFLTEFVSKPIKDYAKGCYNSHSFFKRHIVSRLTYALLAVSCLVTRAFDGVIGAVAAALSILTLGNFESLNNLAYRGLQAPGIVADLFYCATKFVNPWTGTDRA